jgi:glucosyl-3-phosphoglycerate synthase
VSQAASGPLAAPAGVCFVTAEPCQVSAHDARALLAALAADPAVELVAGVAPGRGGRVAPLTARPLLDAFFPQLAAALRDPLPAVIAIRREAVADLSLAGGPATGNGLLIDVYARAGVAAIAQVDLATIAAARPLPPLEAEAPQAAEIVAAVALRLREDGRLSAPRVHCVRASCILNEAVLYPQE